MTETRLTYGEVRSNAEKIADSILKERIIRGIELLEKEYGPDWVERIDPGTLSLRSPDRCVLGQVYADEQPTEEQIKAAYEVEPDFFSGHADDPDYDRSGYFHGLIILDGDVLKNPHEFGFDRVSPGSLGGVDYDDLDDAWQIVFGEEEA